MSEINAGLHQVLVDRGEHDAVCECCDRALFAAFGDEWETQEAPVYPFGINHPHDGSTSITICQRCINDPTPIRPDMPEQTVGAMFDRQDQALRAIVNGLGTEVAKLDDLLTALINDPVAFVRLGRRLHSPETAAEILGLHPETVRGYTRLAEDHPDHLPRVSDKPLRILPADLANWIVRNRAS
jgi:hypothetical protein